MKTSDVVRMLMRIIFLVVLMASLQATAQSSRVDLDDVSIQGELLSDDRIRLMSRSRNSIAEQIKFRSSFRPEILEHLPHYFTRVPELQNLDKSWTQTPAE